MTNIVDLIHIFERKKNPVQRPGPFSRKNAYFNLASSFFTCFALKGI